MFRSKFVLALCLLFSMQNSMAEQQVLKLQNGLTATADYYVSDGKKITALVMHPFLQTSDFSVVANLTETLVDEGFGVLLPTLTLGIDARQQSKDCEAIHTQSFENDQSELEEWADWLKKHTSDRIVLIGHSSGASLIARSLASNPPHKVSTSILISPVHYGHPGGAGMLPEQRAQALKDQESGKADELVQYKISYCDKYTTTRSNYLDITSVDEDTMQTYLDTIKPPIHIVYGSNDESLNASWREKINSGDHTIHEVLEGNHFFSGPSEFDMHDTILDIMNEQ